MTGHNVKAHQEHQSDTSTVRSPWIFALIILTLLVIAFILWENRDQRTSDQSVPLPTIPVINPTDIVSLLPPDAIPAIDNPQFEEAGAAVEHLKSDERVIGMVINGDARAYPINILSSHEIVNDVVGGEPVAVTWCPLCYSALVFSRTVDGGEESLTFGVSGKLLYNTLVMFDRESGSLWSQLYGGGIQGRWAGTSLLAFPSIHTDWSTWYGEHPDSQVLSKEITREQFQRGTYAEAPRSSYYVDPYESYYLERDEGVINRNIPRDDRSLLPKQKVLGVRTASSARAYPYSVLNDQPLVNDEIDGVPVMVWFDSDSQTGRAFERTVNGQVLVFDDDPQNPNIMIDEITGSRWNALNGEAIAGSLEGERLSPLIVTPAFEFGWYDYFPESSTYGE